MGGQTEIMYFYKKGKDIYINLVYVVNQSYLKLRNHNQPICGPIGDKGRAQGPNSQG